MRISRLRTSLLVLSAFVLVSCMGESITGPAAPVATPRADVVAGGGIIITEVMPDPTKVLDAAGEWFELYNAGTDDINLKNYKIVSAAGLTASESHTIASDVLIRSGQYLVIGNNANTATNGGVTEAYSYGGSIALNNGSTTSANEWLALRDPSNVTLDSVAYVARVLPAAPGPYVPPAGASRGVINLNADNTVVSGPNWATATSTYGLGDKGTPGAANDGASNVPPPPPPPPPPPVGAIVINEIMANPSAVLDSLGEWFEVINRTASPIDLQGWTIASNGDPSHVIASSVVVPAGGFAVIGRDGDASENGGLIENYSYPSFGSIVLANSTDYLALRDGTGATIDSVAWSGTVSAGVSRSLNDANTDNTDMLGAAWFNSTTLYGNGDKGTPGAANTSVPSGSPGVPAAVSISINTPAQAPVGYTKPAFATVRDGVGAIMSPPPRLTWSSTNPAVATVDTLGYITAVSVGTTVVRATTANGIIGSANFTVIPATAPTTAVYRNHLEFGTPLGGDAGILLTKTQYVESYNATRGGPNWVSWDLNATQFGAAPRCDCFSADQTLPPDVYHVVDFDYRNGGYDRGHMVQSESRTTTDQENATTFLLTNILPQAGNNNQGPWALLENALNDLVRSQGKEVYVIAGGIYAPSPTTLKNEGKVAIPDYTWKIAVIVGAGQGLANVTSTSDLQVIAVRIPNLLSTAATIRNAPWQQFITTVDQIELQTGYDFLAALPDNIERIVEANDRYPVASAGGPYSSAEGSSLTFNGTGSTDPDNDLLTYTWTFGDGGTGTGATPSHTYADNGSYAVTLIVTDPYGAADTAVASAAVSNVAPAVSAFAGATLLPGEPYSTSGSFTDPGADTWSATVNYGDGTGTNTFGLTGFGFSLSHLYTTPGTYTVTVSVTDDDGGNGVSTATVTVLSPSQAIDNLQNDVNALSSSLGKGKTNALTSLLDNAAKSISKGNNGAAANQLGAFTNQVSAKVKSGDLTKAQGDALIAAAQRIITSIGG